MQPEWHWVAAASKGQITQSTVMLINGNISDDIYTSELTIIIMLHNNCELLVGQELALLMNQLLLTDSGI